MGDRGSAAGLADAGALISALRRLPMGGSVLHIGAHPDDEDVGLMTWVSQGLSSEITYWSATRGAGGQNRVGPESGPALGVIRTWEAEAARALDGGHVLYGPFIDFGFCKSGAEALRKWGAEPLIASVARAIRRLRPQIVVARWTGGDDDGHGHHQALGEVTDRALEQAENPEVSLAWGTKPLAPWRPTKIYRSCTPDWQPGEELALGGRRPDLEAKGRLCIDAGRLDPVWGESYQERGFRAFNSYRSQAIGFPPAPGPYLYYYERVRPELVASQTPETDIHDGLDATIQAWAPLDGHPAIAERLRSAHEHFTAAAAEFRADHRRPSGALVLQGLTELRALQEELGSSNLSAAERDHLKYRVGRRIDEAERAAAACLGLRLELMLSRARVAQGQGLTAQLALWDQGERVEACAQVELHLPTGFEIDDADSGPGHRSLLAPVRLRVGAGAELSSPPWLVDPPGEYCYASSPGLRGAGTAPVSGLWAEAWVDTSQGRLRLQAEGLQREGFAGGYRELPISVVSPLTLRARPEVLVLAAGDHPVCVLEVEVELGPDQPATEGVVLGTPPPGWRLDPPERRISLTSPGEQRSASFELYPPDPCPAGAHPIPFHFEAEGRRWSARSEAARLGAPGLPRPADPATCVREAFIHRQAALQAHVVDMRLEGSCRVGYLRGADEPIFDLIGPLCGELHELDAADLRPESLRELDLVIVGPNAFLIRPELAEQRSLLLDYVAEGGTLVVQYQSYDFAHLGVAPAPFGYSQPHDRVTSADAPVRLLESEHALLTFPNQIGVADFEGWRRDRGLYFFGSWDGGYTPLLEISDPGEAPKRGALMVASHGRGAFIYTGLSFFRQLPAGVSGAWRLFANVLSYPEARLRQRVELLAELPLFSGLDPAQLRAIARVSTERWVEAGEWLAHKGETGKELFIVTRGSVEVRSDSSPDAKLIATEGRGKGIGEFAVLTQVPRTASLRAAQRTHLMALERGDFQALLRQSPELGEAMMAMLVQKLLEREAREPRR